MAKVYFQQCFYDSVLQVLPYSLTLDPTAREYSYRLLLQSLFHLKKSDSLNLALETLPNDFPYSRPLQLTVAQAFENTDRLDQAETVYRNLIRLFPNDPQIKDALDQLGSNPFPSCSTPLEGTLLQSENLSTSVENLLNTHPRNPWLWLALWESLKESNPQRAQQLRLHIIKEFPDLSARLPFDEPDNSGQPSLAIGDEIPDSLASQVIASLDKKKSLDSELGHYLVHWGLSKNQFFSRYDAKAFAAIDDSILTQSDTLLGFKSSYFLIFTDDKLEKVIGEFEDPEHRLDVLGRVLRAKSKLSGPPRNSGDMDCPGFKKFQFFVWEGVDHFELIAQFGSKTWQARMLRVPGYFAQDKQICDIAPLLVPPKESQ